MTHAKVYDRTADAVVCYAGSRAAVIGAFARYNKADAALDAYLPAHSTRALNREFEDNLVGVTVRRFASKLFFPAPLRAVLAVIRGIRYVWKGLSALRRGKLTVEVLDATAVSVSLLRGDFKTRSGALRTAPRCSSRSARSPRMTASRYAPATSFRSTARSSRAKPPSTRRR